MTITRNQRKVECPFCKSEFLTGGIASHFKVCGEMPNDIQPDERRKLYLTHNYKINVNDLIERYNLGESLPDLSVRFNNAPFTVIIEILNNHGIEIRGVKDKTVNETRMAKYRQTCQEKYGADNALSKDTISYHKRNNTVKDRYGVLNVFQNEEIKKKILNDQTYLDRYGLTRSALLSKKGKENWEKLSDEEKTLWYERSLGKTAGDPKSGSRTPSRLESRVKMILSEKMINFESQFPLFYSCDNKKRWCFYDIRLSDTNILIEVNR